MAHNTAKGYMDAMTKKGKIITINIKILDSEKAAELMDTMYNRNLEYFGIEVQSWGAWDIQKANKLRINALESEIDSHWGKIQALLGKRDLDYLEEAENSQD